MLGTGLRLRYVYALLLAQTPLHRIPADRLSQRWSKIIEANVKAANELLEVEAAAFHECESLKVWGGTRRGLKYGYDSCT